MFAQSLFVQESLVEKVTYNGSLNLLATLHGNLTLGLTKLDLDLDSRICSCRVLKVIPVAYGLGLVQRWFHKTEVMLFQDKSITYPERKVDRTQLISVDTETGQVRVMYVPVKNVARISMFKDSILITTFEQNRFKMFEMPLNQVKGN